MSDITGRISASLKRRHNATWRHTFVASSVPASGRHVDGRFVVCIGFIDLFAGYEGGIHLG